jgi:hypothetical protein
MHRPTRVVISLACVLWIGFALASAAVAAELAVVDGSFELAGIYEVTDSDGDGTMDAEDEDSTIQCAGGRLFPDSDGTASWRCSGDVTVLALHPCLQPQLPSDPEPVTGAEIAFAACLSTESLWGGAATGGVRSDLVSPPVSIPFKPGSITVGLDFEFGTDEGARSAPFDDALTVTLLTDAGPIPMMTSDTWGTTFNGQGLTLTGTPAFSQGNPGCPVSLQTGRVSAAYRRSISSDLSLLLRETPIYVQISVSDTGDAGRLSFACVDKVSVKASKR